MDSFISDDNPHAAVARAYLAALLRIDSDAARHVVERALEAGTPLEAIYLDVLAATQEEIGRLWQVGQLSVAQEHYCTAASQSVLANLGRRAFAARRNGRAMLATCVDGNLHEFGLRMVADFFEMAGWKTVYLGAGLPALCIVDAVASAQASVVCLSASLERQVPAVEEALGALRADPRTAAVRILVGGHAFKGDNRSWRRVGADGFAADARAAVQLACGMVA